MMMMTIPMTRTKKKRKSASAALLSTILLSHAGIFPGVAFSFSLESFWAAERAEHELKVHEAARRRDEFLRDCAGTAPRSAGERFACRLIGGERVEASPWLALPFARWFHPTASVSLTELKGLPFAEKAQWEARAFISPLRPAEQTTGQGWLALESTVRLSSDRAEPRWWRYQALISARDPRRDVTAFDSTLFSSDAADPNRRDRLDGVSYGIAPFFGVRTFRGGVAGARLWDDRLGDRRQAVELSAQAATNATFSAGGAFSDGEWTAPLRSRLEAGAYSDQFRYVANVGATRFREEGVWASAQLTFPLIASLTARLGGRLLARGDERAEGPGPLAAQAGATLGGPVAALAWDTLDSRTTPRSGLLFEVEATKNFGAFWEGKARAGAHYSFSRKVSASVIAVASAQEGSPRRNLLTGWGREWLNLPGIQENRYRAPAGLGACVELQGELARNVRGLIFGTGVGMRNPLATTDSFIGGGGVGMEIAMGIKTRPTLRGEFAVMDGAVVFNVDWKAAF